MPLLLVLVLLAVLGGIALVAAGRGGAMAPVLPDRAPTGVLDDAPIDGTDVGRLRFSLAFRGYRMDEVDDVLDRLASELADRDQRIAELEQQLRGESADPPRDPDEG